MPFLPNPDYLSHPRMKAAVETVDASVQVDAMGQFLPAFQRNYAEWIKVGRPDFDARIGEGDAVLAELQRDGVALLKVSDRDKAELVALAAPYIGVLESKLSAMESKPKFRDMNLALDRGENRRLYEVAQAALSELHAFEIAAAYLRQPMKIKKLFVQLNNAWETKARYGVIDDAGLPPLKTDYWHIDSDIWPSLKVLIYLNDVDLDRGPMRYVVGSHRELPCFETVVRKTNDTLRLPTRQFLALPDELRMHALFGPFLLGEEPQAYELLRRERALCGGGADLVLFDNNGVHRGGFVRTGARHILQCLFEAA